MWRSPPSLIRAGSWVRRQQHAPSTSSRGPLSWGHGRQLTREDGLPQRDAGHGLGLDRVGPATLTRRTAGPGHQPGVDADDLVTRGQQVGFEAAGEMPTILDRNQDLWSEPTDPQQSPVMPGRGGRDHQPILVAAKFIDRDQGVRPFVSVHADDRHGTLRRAARHRHSTGAGLNQSTRADSYQATPWKASTRRGGTSETTHGVRGSEIASQPRRPHQSGTTRRLRHRPHCH